MAYLNKNIQALIDLKITDKGRELISTGQFCDIKYFQIGDSEYDYTNEDIFNRNSQLETQRVLRAKDKDTDIKYPIPVGDLNSENLKCLTYGAVVENHSQETVSQKMNRFGITNGISINSPQHVGIDISLFDGTKILPITGVSVGDYLMIKYPPVPSNDIDNDGLILWYKVMKTSQTAVELDRVLPDYTNFFGAGIEASIFVYKDDNSINYWDFNIVSSEETIGSDNNLSRKYSAGSKFYSTKEFLGYTSHVHSDDYEDCNVDDTTTTTTTICPPVNPEDEIIDGTVQYFYDSKTQESWDYSSLYKNSFDEVIEVLPSEQKFIGIIHYTKMANYFGTGEWWAEGDSDFRLNLPTLMYHRDGGNIGHEFTMGSDKKYVISEVNDELDQNGEVYYDLLDSTIDKNIVGKVFPYKQIIVIDDEEILMAMSMKSNRNYTLPSPKAGRISADADCNDSTGSLLPDDLSKEVYVTYMFLDENTGLYSMPCAQYGHILPKSDDNYDVSLSFLNGFDFLRDSDISQPNHGYQATKMFALVQQVDAGELPLSDEWRYIDITNSLVNLAPGSNITSSNIVGKKYVITADDYVNAQLFSIEDTIGYPMTNDLDNMIIGDEFMLMGDITLHKQHSVYVMGYYLNLPDNQFVRSQNPTWDLDNAVNPDKQDLRITEVGLYNENKDMVAIGKFSIPYLRPLDPSTAQVISVKIDF